MGDTEPSQEVFVIDKVRTYVRFVCEANHTGDRLGGRQSPDRGESRLYAAAYGQR